VEDISMKARKNPTDQQVRRRLRRPPESPHDPRFRTDPYWVLRNQKHPHNYAKRAFRDQPPVVREVTIADIEDEYSRDMDEQFFPVGSTYTTIEVEVRPDLSEDAIRDLKPRDKEYTVFDSDIMSFGVRVRPSGYKCYIISFRGRHDSKRRKRTIGRVGKYSLDEARGIARDMRREARGDIDPLSAP
jgi:hypothetical protein